MNERIGAETFFPIVDLALGVFERAMMLEGAIEVKSIGEVGVGVVFVVGVEVELAEFDAALSFFCPVVSLLLALEVIADCEG